MAATNNSGLGHGSNGSPQMELEELLYPAQVTENEAMAAMQPPPRYAPSAKHEPGGYGSSNPIQSYAEGQMLLDTGYRHGQQIYNVTSRGEFVKFQRDNMPNNGYHAYKANVPKDVPSAILRQMLADGKITRTDYNKCRRGTYRQ